MAMRWYIVHAHSGFEKKVAQAIREQAVQNNIAHLIEEVAVPVEEAPVSVPADSDAPTRIELVEKANQLGLKFSKRTSDEKLLDMITEALSKQEA